MGTHSPAASARAPWAAVYLWNKYNVTVVDARCGAVPQHVPQSRRRSFSSSQILVVGPQGGEITPGIWDRSSRQLGRSRVKSRCGIDRYLWLKHQTTTYNVQVCSVGVEAALLSSAHRSQPPVLFGQPETSGLTSHPLLQVVYVRSAATKEHGRD